MNEEFEVVWNGTMDKEGTCPSLVEDRVSKPSEFWEPPKRLYNKKSEFWKNPVKTKKSEEDPKELERA